MLCVKKITGAFGKEKKEECKGYTILFYLPSQ
jgi:hypothetical protein